MRKVLYLNHVAKLGGAEFALARLLEAMDRSKIEPLVVLAESGPFEEELKRIGVEYRIIGLGEEIRELRKGSVSAKTIFSRSAGLFGYAIKIARFAREQRVDLIHTNSMKAHFYGGLAGRLARIPVVWHVRDYIDESYLPSTAVKMVRTLARVLPSRIVAVSQSVLVQVHLPAYSPKGRYIYDGLTSRELPEKASRNRADSWPAVPKVGIVGSLRPWKGQHIFLKAAAEVLRRGYDAEFIVVGGVLFGEEDYEAYLKRLTKELGLGSRVRFLGFRRDVSKILDTLDILVHASTSADPCPNTVLEGMAAGLPIIGTRGGGVPELLANDCGVLTPMGDEEALADAIAELLENPSRAHTMAGNGFTSVRNNFTSSRTAEQVLGIYGEVAPLTQSSGRFKAA